MKIHPLGDFTRAIFQEFFLPEGYNYENVTSLQISSCTSANLHFSSLTEANQIEEVIVENISERLILELFLTSTKMKTFRLSRIREIPLITHDTFTRLRAIDSILLEDVFVENFEEEFADIAVKEFAMINTTIARLGNIGFSGRGSTFRIVDTDFQNITGSLNIAYFSNVYILRSKFALQKPGHLLIVGDTVLLEDSVFSNASTNIVAASEINVRRNCADGKSSLRLSSDSSRVAVYDNRLPTEIVRTDGRKQSTDSRYFLKSNNTVCIAANCRCPKTSGEISYQPTILVFVLQVLQMLAIWNSS